MISQYCKLADILGAQQNLHKLFRSLKIEGKGICPFADALCVFFLPVQEKRNRVLCHGFAEKQHHYQHDNRAVLGCMGSGHKTLNLRIQPNLKRLMCCGVKCTIPAGTGWGITCISAASRIWSGLAMSNTFRVMKRSTGGRSHT